MEARGYTSIVEGSHFGFYRIGFSIWPKQTRDRMLMAGLLATYTVYSQLHALGQSYTMLNDRLNCDQPFFVKAPSFEAREAHRN